MAEYIENWEELGRKYAGTYVMYGGELIYIHQFDMNEEHIVFGYQKMDSKHTVMDEFDEHKLVPLSPNSLLFNHCESLDKIKGLPLLAFQKSPRRQWRRSLNGDIAEIWCPLDHLYVAFDQPPAGQDQRLTLDMVWRILNPTYPSILQAMSLVPQCVGLAVGPEHFVSLSNISNTKLLFGSIFGFIGELDGDSRTITINHPPALQEVKDFLNRTNQRMFTAVECPN